MKSFFVPLSRFGWEKRWIAGIELRNPFYPLARYLCGLPPAKLSVDYAVQIFKEAAAGKGWPVRPPICIIEGLKRYYLRDNNDASGNNIICEINVNTGEVIGVAVIPY